MRLDKFLKVSRIIKRRTVAKEACDKGIVTINGKVAKSSSEVNIGDLLEIQFGEKKMKFKINEIREHVLKNDAKEMYEIVMGEEDKDNTPQVETVDVTGKVEEIRSIITGGETYFYIKLQDNATYYKVAVKNAERIVILNVGDTITFTVDKDAKGEIVSVNNVK